MYPIELTGPMVLELNKAGIHSLKSPLEVDNALVDSEGTALVVINSVCGCAARNARPGVIHAVSSNKIPNKLYTVFAGVDNDAVKHIRENYLLPNPPSSPSIALFKNGKLVYFMERYKIEGNTAEGIANELVKQFDNFC